MKSLESCYLQFQTSKINFNKILLPTLLLCCEQPTTKKRKMLFKELYVRVINSFIEKTIKKTRFLEGVSRPGFLSQFYPLYVYHREAYSEHISTADAHFVSCIFVSANLVNVGETDGRTKEMRGKPAAHSPRRRNIVKWQRAGHTYWQ